MLPANDNEPALPVEPVYDKLTLAVILLADQKLSIESGPITVPFERLQFLFDNIIVACRHWLQELETHHG